jgi:hypothetical protein
MKLNDLSLQTEFGTYRQTFFDGFDAPILDRTKWIPYYLPQWSSRAKTQPRYRIENSCLILEIQPDQEPWSPEFNGNIRVSSLQTGLYSGALNSAEGQHRFSKGLRVREPQPTERTYTPLYGYFELKAKCNILPNNVAALWMIGFEDQPDHSAEICIFELKGHNIRAKSAVIGYGVHPFGDPSITDEFYEEEFPVDVTQFNTYAAEWTEQAVHFYINEKKIRTIEQSPQYPMQFMLNIYDLSDIPAQKQTMEFSIESITGYERKQE